MNVEIVFIFVFVIIVIAFVLVGAIHLFGKSGFQSCISALDAQVNSIRNDVTDIYYTAKDSSKTIRIGVDRTCAGKICFFNPVNPGPNPSKNWEGNPTYENIVKDNKYIIGIIDSNGGFEGRTVTNLKPAESFCVDESQSLQLINRGEFVDITIKEA